MDKDKMPHVPDFSPSGEEVKPVTSGKKIDSKTKFSIGALLALFALIAVSAVAVGNPINIAKRAFTPPSAKDANYNRSVYGLDCPSPNYWAVAEANPAECSPENTSIKCGELCPENRQTNITNSEGHQCCRPTEIVTIPTKPVEPTRPIPTETITIPTKPVEPTRPIPNISIPDPTTTETPPQKCIQPKAPTDLKIVFPVCTP